MANIDRLHLSRIYTNDAGVLTCGFGRHLRPTSECEYIETYIQERMDWKHIRPGSTVGLNFICNEPATATAVEIGEKAIAPEIFEMRVKHTREVGGHTTLKIGTWSPGEGRLSIRQVLGNYLAGCIDPRDVHSPDSVMYTKCPNPAHGLLDQRGINENLKPNTSYKMICLFNIVFESMCTECLRPIAGDKSWGIPDEAKAWADNA